MHALPPRSQEGLRRRGVAVVTKPTDPLTALLARLNVPEGGLSHREIAKRLGISHGRVIQIERDALAKMRKAVAREWGEP